MMMFKQPLFWKGALIVLVLTVVVGLALFGTVASVQPKQIPVALVNLDQKAGGDGGPAMQLGDMLQQKLLSAKSPIQWTVLGSVEEANQGLDEQKYYGALIIPKDASSGVLSLMTPAPLPATFRIFVNEGMQAELSGKVGDILTQILNGAADELTKQLLAQMKAQGGNLPIDTASALLNPFHVEMQTVHAIGADNAEGNAPVMLTLISWLISLVSSVVLYLILKHTVPQGANRAAAILSQGAAGIVLAGVCTLLLVWMCASWYGMEANHWNAAWLFLWLICSAFFVLQSALLNLGGLRAVALLVLLLFFSIPILNVPPELLPTATKDWLYSWNPLRLAAAGLRERLYFDTADSGILGAMWGILGGFAILLAAAGLRKRAD